MMKSVIFVDEVCEFVVGFLIKLINGFSVGINLNFEVKGIFLVYVNDICVCIKKVKDDYVKDGIFDGRVLWDLNVIKLIIDLLSEKLLFRGVMLVNEILFKDGVISFNIKGEYEYK